MLNKYCLLLASRSPAFKKQGKGPGISLLGMYLKEWKTGTQTKTCTPMVIEDPFTIAKRWTQHRRPSADEWISNMGSPTQWNIIQPWKGMEFSYRPLQRMNLENIMLSERRQTQNTTHYMVPFTWNIQTRQIHRDRKQISGFQGWWRWSEKWFFPFWNKENALNLGVVIDGHHCEYITKNIKRKNFMACELYLIKDLKNVYSLLQ